MATTILQRATFFSCKKSQFHSENPAGAVRKTTTPSRSLVSSFRCQASRDSADVSVSRRNVVSLVAGTAPIFYAAQAMALIDYDTDDALLEKIRADRNSKIQTELSIERNSTRAQGYKNPKFDGELQAIQTTVNQLSKSGEALKAGDMGAYKSAVTGSSWIQEFKKSSAEISNSATAKEAAGSVYKALDNLEQTAGTGAGQATKSYLATVSAFEDWCASSGIGSQVQGL